MARYNEQLEELQTRLQTAEDLASKAMLQYGELKTKVDEILHGKGYSSTISKYSNFDFDLKKEITFNLILKIKKIDGTSFLQPKELLNNNDLSDLFYGISSVEILYDGIRISTKISY